MAVGVLTFAFDPVVKLGDSASVRIETIVIAIVLLAGLILAARIGQLTPAAGPYVPAPGLRADDLLFIAVGVVPGALLGGRLGYVLDHLDYYRSNPGVITDFSQGGLNLTLAVPLGILTGAIIARLIGAPVARWLHATAFPPPVRPRGREARRRPRCDRPGHARRPAVVHGIRRSRPVGLARSRGGVQSRPGLRGAAHRRRDRRAHRPARAWTWLHAEMAARCSPRSRSGPWPGSSSPSGGATRRWSVRCGSTGSLEHCLRSRERESRHYGIAQLSFAVEPLNQRAAGPISRIRRLMEFQADRLDSP